MFGAEDHLLEMPRPLEEPLPGDLSQGRAVTSQSVQVKNAFDNRDRAAFQAHDADAQFSYGALLEAKATTESRADPKAAQHDFESALEAYRRAHELEPANAAYKSAYDRLRRKLKPK